MVGMLGSVIYIQIILATALIAMLPETVYAFPMQCVFPCKILHDLCTVRLSNPNAGFVRSAVLSFFANFGDLLVVSLITQQPLPDNFPVLLLEFLILFGLLKLVSQAWFTKVLSNDFVRGTLFLGYGYLKSNSMVKNLHSILVNDFSTHSIAFALLLGMISMMVVPFLNCLDLLLVSKLEIMDFGTIKRRLKVGFFLVSVIIGTLYCFLILANDERLKTQSRLLTNVVGNACFLIYFGYEAIRCRRFFLKSD